MLNKPKPCKHCSSTAHQAYQCFYRPPKNAKPCRHCHKTGHLSWQCFDNPNRTIETKKKLKSGRITLLWIKVRREWFIENPPDENGYYYCYLCGKPMLPSETTLDHKKSRSRHPELRFVKSNLAPCCWNCNHEKGSKNDDEIV